MGILGLAPFLLQKLCGAHESIHPLATDDIVIVHMSLKHSRTGWPLLVERPLPCKLGWMMSVYLDPTGLA